VPAEVYERTTSAAREAGSSAHDAWNATFNTWASSNPDKRDLLQRLTSKQTPATFNDARPTFGAGVPVATRKAFGRALKAAAAELPELWGGSADLGESNNTTIDDASSFLPASSDLPGANPAGQTDSLGHSGTLHGRGHERHLPLRPQPPLRRNVPRLQRLHATSRPPRRADEVAGRI
jgi:transketolase